MTRVADVNRGRRSVRKSGASPAGDAEKDVFVSKTRSSNSVPVLLALGAGALLMYLLGSQRGRRRMTLARDAVARLATRAVAGHNLKRTLRLSGGRRAVDIRKTIHIAAPPDRVFDCWSNIDSFPRFMARAEEVRRLDDDRSHRGVRGPARARLEWDSEITERIRPEMLAWRSKAGTPVQHAGIVHFDEVDDGTQVSVRMRYNPPGGVFGHLLASLFGRAPTQDLDADLKRMKSFIESGAAAPDSAQPATSAAI